MVWAAVGAVNAAAGVAAVVVGGVAGEREVLGSTLPRYCTKDSNRCLPGTTE